LPAAIAFVCAIAAWVARYRVDSDLEGLVAGASVVAYVTGLRLFELWRFEPVHRSALLLLYGAGIAMAGGTTYGPIGTAIGAAILLAMWMLFRVQKRCRARTASQSGPVWWAGGVLAAFSWMWLTAIPGLIGYADRVDPIEGATPLFDGRRAFDATALVLLWFQVKRHPWFPRLTIAWFAGISILTICVTEDRLGGKGLRAWVPLAIATIIVAIYLATSKRVAQTFARRS